MTPAPAPQNPPPTQPPSDGGTTRAHGGEEWISLDDQPPSGASIHADRIANEFLRAPEGEVRDGSLVVRPSLWAALERSVTVFGVLLALMVPALVAIFFGGDADDPERMQGRGIFALLDFSLTLLIPLLAALTPAVQLIFTRYILDDEGIRERVQLLSRTERRVQWDKVTALRHRVTIMDRLLGMGRVDVVAYGERGTTIRLVGLRHAPQLRGFVARRMRESASVERLFGND